MGNVLKAIKHDALQHRKLVSMLENSPENSPVLTKKKKSFLFSPFSLMQMDILAMSILELVMTK